MALSFFLLKKKITQKLLKQMSLLIKKGEFQIDRMKGREHGEFPIFEPGDLNFMDVAPNQIVGVSASLIPFWRMMMLTEL